MEELSYTPSKGNSPKYQLLMELGKGGMGVVHLAMSRGPQGFTKLLVLKIMRRELLGEDELLQMFLEEARISARLAHPNIVHVFEVGEHEGCPCIVMEYLEGQPLSSMLVRAPEKPPLPLHLQVLAKALAGLHAAHELRDYDGTSLKLVHRDVSPHNVFVLFDGQVKVLDFGIAKAAGSEIETRTGSPKGKIRYMSPEQLIRDPLDCRADVFSVGVLMWEALARRRMWGEREEGDVTRALLNRKIPPLPEGDHIPAELRAICMRALAPDPVDRYPSAEAFQRDLEKYLQGLPEPCGAEELGAFLRAQFGELRQATKKLIDFHIKSAQPSPSSTGNTPNTPSKTSKTRRPTNPPRTTGPSPIPAVALPAPLPAPIDGLTGDALTRAYPPPAAIALDPSAVTVTPMTGPSHHWNRLVIVGAIGGLLAFLLAGATFLRGSTIHAEAPRAGEAAAAFGPASPAPVPTCGPGFKLCGSECVSIDRPDYGCGGESCQSCRVSNATARCNLKHECDLAICYQSFDDCDGDSRNGCETDLRIDSDHCGSCSRKCPALAHAQRGCGDTCTIWRCDNGYGDCNGEAADGCEINTQTDAANCGHCGVACGPGQKCRRGECAK
jgi:serine/threonine protein kinase